MSIFKRGKFYWYHFVFNGEHVQESTKQGNPRVARQIEAAHRTALAKGEVGIREKEPLPPFNKAMENFLNWSRKEHAAHPRTHSRYRTSSTALLKYFGALRLDTITPEDVERFKTQRAGEVGSRTRRNLRPATVNRELACGKAMYNFAKKGQSRLGNPFSGVRFLPEDNEQMRVLTYEEQQKYLDAASQPLRDIAILMLETGMRPEEVYRLAREHVHLDSDYAFVPFGKTKAAKRKINLTTSAGEILRKRLTDTQGRYLFPHEKDRNQPMLKVNNAHEGALRRSRVSRFRLYDLRHTWATRAAMSGIDLVTLAAMLGHSRIQMVLRYAHPTEQHQAQAMKRLEQFNAEKQVAEFERKARQPLHLPLQ
jgi:integrase